MKRLIIDTDTAGDDVTSLLFGLLWPDVSLEAITVCAGNVELDLCVRNALLTVEATGRTDVPVHPGAAQPLLRPLVTAHYVHGEDGMGDLGSQPPPALAPDPVDAVTALCEITRRYPGQVEIIAQAPLTNIALAVRRDPGLPARVKRLWVMGGANNALGNITPAAEFNFYVDPEAAHAVLNSGFPTTIVPWDVCVNDGVVLRDELSQLGPLDSPVADFYLKTQAATSRFVARKTGIDGITHPDSLMIAMAIDPQVVVASQEMFVDVEYRSELTRGYSLMDAGGVMHDSLDDGTPVRAMLGVRGGDPNASVVTRADKHRFMEMLAKVLA